MAAEERAFKRSAGYRCIALLCRSTNQSCEEPSLVLASCALLLVLAVSLVGRHRKSSALSRLPHPPRWPLIGNALQMTSHGRSDQQLETWAKQYGPVFTVQIFNMTWVVVSGADELHEMLVSKSRAFSGRYKWFRVSLAVHPDKDITLGNPTIPMWSSMRKAMHRAIQPIGNNMNRIESILIEMAQQLVVKLRLYCGKEIDLQDDLYDFVAKVSVVMVIGKKVDDVADNEKLLQDLKTYERLLRESLSSISGTELDMFPWLRFLGHPLWKKLQGFCRMRDSLWERLWQEGCNSFSSDKRASSIIQAIAQMFDEDSPFYESSMTMEHAVSMFTDVVAASVSTTTATAYALMNQLVHNPRIFKCLQREADDVIGHSRGPNLLDREAMPYTTATIFEVLRLHSTLPTLFPHMTLEDTTLSSYAIPANTIVMPLVCHLHHDESFWGDPLIFRPERFLDDNGKLVPPEHANRKHLKPFGAGTRECVGEIFALRRLFFFITSMVQAFDLEAGDVLVSCDPAYYEDGLLLTQRSFKLRLIPRKIE